MLFQENFCLNCHAVIHQLFGWSDILYHKSVPLLCADCEQKLLIIQGERCHYCSRQLNLLEPEYVMDGYCLDCVRWFENGHAYLDGCHVIFQYNAFLKETIARIKYRGDYELIKMFAPYFHRYCMSFIRSKAAKPIFVAIPLSEQRQLERGFNQVEAIATAVGIPLTNVLSRIHSEKQSKKGRAERIHGEQVFQANGIDLSGRTIILLDDIYTTGTTLQHAAQILKANCGASQVYGVALARG